MTQSQKLIKSIKPKKQKANKAIANKMAMAYPFKQALLPEAGFTD
jgi:hypothetical protein